MWPYIDVADLIQAKTLLIFLNARGWNPPNVFVEADLEATHVGMVSGAILLAYLNGYAVYFDEATPNRYGRLVSFQDDGDAFEHIMSGLAHNVGEGFHILVVQKGVYEFLVGCCYALLHDMDKALLTSPSGEVQPEPPAILPDASEWPTLAAVVAEAPYRVPAKIDFAQLEAIISARRAAVEDHLWALREDPAYFREAVIEESEHRIETLLDAYGKQDPRLTKDNFWPQVYSTVVTDAHGNVVVYEYLHRQIKELTRLEKRWGDRLSLTGELPMNYLYALISFKASLCVPPVSRYCDSAMDSPPLLVSGPSLFASGAPPFVPDCPRI